MKVPIALVFNLLTPRAASPLFLEAELVKKVPLNNL